MEPTMDPAQIMVSECPVCSGTEFSTGNTRDSDDGRAWLEFTCEDCGLTGYEWKAEYESKADWMARTGKK